MIIFSRDDFFNHGCWAWGTVWIAASSVFPIFDRACIQRLKMIPSCLKSFAVKPVQTPSWASGLVGTWKEFDNFCAYFTGTLYCQYIILCVCAILVLFYTCFTLYFQEWHDDKLRWEPSEYGGVEEIYVPRWFSILNFHFVFYIFYICWIICNCFIYIPPIKIYSFLQFQWDHLVARHHTLQQVSFPFFLSSQKVIPEMAMISMMPMIPLNVKLISQYVWSAFVPT